ncbi:MAG: eCIS core domain-containing protein, partial [Bacteroidia bacterium]
MGTFQQIQRENEQHSQTLIQPQLEVGKEDDEHEKEANHVADKVMKMSDPDEKKKKMGEGTEKIQKMSSGKEEEKMKDEDEGKIQKMSDESLTINKMSDGNGSMVAPQNVEQGINSTKGKGASLPADTQQELGGKMNADFSNVNIHTDSNAVQMNKAIGAKAFTHGNDIYFNQGQYNPTSNQGKHLLAHELTHTVQQGNGINRKIQRTFMPEDAVEEMIGKQFSLNSERKGKLATYPKGSIITITKWENVDSCVTGNIVVDKKTYSVYVEKQYLTPVKDTKSGLYQYSGGVEGTQKKYKDLEKEIDAKEKEIKEWESQKDNFKKNPNAWQERMDLRNTELKDLQYRLTGDGYTSATLPDRLKHKDKSGNMVSITPQSELLNRDLIQETMFNAHDASIKKWVDYYNKEIGVKKNWSTLDANYVKSMVFQESQMGTFGEHLLKVPRVEYDVKTRFNVMQAIDSSGAEQLIMMNENDKSTPSLDSKYKYNDVTKDLYKAQKRRAELLKIKTLSTTEQSELDTINNRSENGNHWDTYYWTDFTRFVPAVKDFFKQTTKNRNMDYDFWV